MTTRKDFIKTITLASAAFSMPDVLSENPFLKEKTGMHIGLVTYQWGRDWDIPTIIQNCTKSKVLGVELRVHHKHGVDTDLTSAQREKVKKQFEDSEVTLVGYGSNVHFDSPDTELLRLNIMRAKALLALDYDIGGSGVKVKPNEFHEGIPHEKTIEQIGKALNEVGKFAGDLGQQLRLEVHGDQTQLLPNIKSIMDVADNPNVGVCWNCNPTDLEGKGLAYNFNLVKDRLGDTLHMRVLNKGDYPYQKLFDLLTGINYSGWCLLECRTEPANKVQAMTKQRQIWERMVAKA